LVSPQTVPQLSGERLPEPASTLYSAAFLRKCSQHPGGTRLRAIALVRAGRPTGTVDGRNFAFLPGRLLPFAGSGRPGFMSAGCGAAVRAAGITDQ
jgi:hypothetical protein